MVHPWYTYGTPVVHLWYPHHGTPIMVHLSWYNFHGTPTNATCELCAQPFLLALTRALAHIQSSYCQTGRLLLTQALARIQSSYCQTRRLLLTRALAPIQSPVVLQAPLYGPGGTWAPIQR